MGSYCIIQTGCYSKYARCIFQAIATGMALTYPSSVSIMRQTKNGLLETWLNVNLKTRFDFSTILIDCFRAIDGEVILNLNNCSFKSQTIINLLKKFLKNVLSLLPENDEKFLLYSGNENTLKYQEEFEESEFLPNAQFDFENLSDALMDRKDVKAVYDELCRIVSFKNPDPFFIFGREKFFNEFAACLREFYGVIAQFLNDLEKENPRCRPIRLRLLSDLYVMKMIYHLLSDKKSSLFKFKSKLYSKTCFSKSDVKILNSLFHILSESPIYEKIVNLLKFAESETTLDVSEKYQIFSMTKFNQL